MRALKQLEQYRPWRGHWGQRALMPTKPLRFTGIEWEATILFTMGASLLSSALLKSDIWIATLGAVIFFLGAVEALRILAWNTVARPLSQGEANHFQSILNDDPRMMKAALHWLTPDTRIRITDLRFLKRINRKLNPIHINSEDIIAARDAFLVGIETHLNNQNAQVENQCVMAKARALSLNHRNTWKPRHLLGLAYLDPPHLSNSALWGEALLRASLSYMFIMFLHFIAKGLSGGEESTITHYLDLGYWPLVCLLIGALHIPLIKIAAQYKPLLTRDYERNHPSSFASAPSFLYLSSIPKRHYWSAQDLWIAAQLGEDNQAPPKTLLAAAVIDAPKKIDCSQVPTIDTRYNSLVRNKWRGHWVQRCLLPTQASRRYVLNHSEYTSIECATALLLASILFLPIAFLSTGGSVFNYLIVIVCALAQIELLRITNYLLISMPSQKHDANGMLNYIEQHNPEMAPLIKQWNDSAFGIRKVDLKAMQKFIRREDPDFFNNHNQDLTLIQQSAEKRTEILSGIASKSMQAPENKSAEALAKHAGKPWKTGKLLHLKLNKATVEIFSLVSCLPLITKLGFLIFPFLLLVGYAATAGLFWAISSMMGQPFTGAAILLPFGSLGFLMICGALSLPLIAYTIIVWHSPVSDFLIHEVFEPIDDELVYAGPYLSNLPYDQEWRYADMWRAYSLIKEPLKKANKADRARENQKRMNSIMESSQASEAFTHIHADELHATTKQVNASVASAPRRL